MDYRIRLIFSEEELKIITESYFIREVLPELSFKTHILKTENPDNQKMEAKVNSLENNFVNLSKNVTLTLQPKSIELISPNSQELIDVFLKYKDQIEISRVNRIAFLKTEESNENFIIQAKIKDLGYAMNEVESYEIHMNKIINFHMVNLNEHITIQKRGEKLIKTLDINTLVGNRLEECRMVYDNLIELVGKYE